MSSDNKWYCDLTPITQPQYGTQFQVMCNTQKGILLFVLLVYAFLFTFAVQIKLRRLHLAKTFHQIHARKLRKEFTLSYHCDKINCHENHSFFFLNSKLITTQQNNNFPRRNKTYHSFYFCFISSLCCSWIHNRFQN